MATFVEHAAASINNYIKKRTNAVMRKRRYVSWLRENGRITQDGSGPSMQWPVRYKRSPTGVIPDAATIPFSRQSTHKAATLPLRSFYSQRTWHEKDFVINQGRSQIYSIVETAADDLLDDIGDAIEEILLNTNGNAAGFTEHPHGIESVFGTNGASTANLYYAPAATYADISTVLGALGGTWTGTWPEGYGDSEYDAWSPLNLGYALSGWAGTGTDTWLQNATEVIRYAIINTEKNGEELDLVLLEKNLYRQYLEAADDKERIQVTKAGPDSTMVKLGFKNVMNQDGTDVTWCQGIAAGVGYGLSSGNIDLKCWPLNGRKQMFHLDKDFNIETLHKPMLVRFWGNQKIASPRGIAKLQA